MDGAQLQLRIPQARCPYCHESIPRGELPGVCAACHTLHHAACLQELGRCATCGLATAHVAAPAAPPAAPPPPAPAPVTDPLRDRPPAPLPQLLPDALPTAAALGSVTTLVLVVTTDLATLCAVSSILGPMIGAVVWLHATGSGTGDDRRDP